MKKSFQATAQWCMAHQKELYVIPMLVLIGEFVFTFQVIQTITNRYLVVMGMALLVSFLPVSIGVLYEFYLSPSNWFLRDDDDGKL